MALLPENDRVNQWAEFMREVSDARDPCSFTKIELRAAIDAIDQWIEDNAVSFNQALPVAFRTKATARQKMKLFVKLLEGRFRNT